MQRGGEELSDDRADQLPHSFSVLWRDIDPLGDSLAEHRRNGESRSHSRNIPYKEKPIRNRRKRPVNTVAILHCVLLILDKPTDGIDQEDDRQFLNRM